MSSPTLQGLSLDRLRIRELRNLEQVDIEPAPRVNVITGNNGQGKTSILEAIYLLATSRSFRTAKLAEVVRHGAEIGSVRGTFAEHWQSDDREPRDREPSKREPNKREPIEREPIKREQSVGVRGGRRSCRINGEAARSSGHYATRSPVVVFDPQQMSLSTGPSSERRTLLDRVTMFTHPEVATHRSRYAKALRERQRLLGDRFPRLSESSELDAYEALLAEHGCAITRARRSATAELAREQQRAFASIAAPDLTLGTVYEPAGSEDEQEARRRLRDDRMLDARRKRTGFGPHRDDLALSIDEHPARVVASQGQHRAITLALKIAELRSIAAARGVLPILLLDDVSSELDADRTEALFDHLAATESQIFLTTTRRDLIVTSRAGPSERHDFHVAGGVVRVA